MNGTRENQKSESAQSVSLHTSISHENLTQEKVRELFDYVDGKLVRIKSSGGVIGGSIAGHLTSLGYVTVRIKRKIYKAHRIVWLWHYGYMPEGDIDHINRDRADNHIENLREAGRVCNARNTGNHTSNTSGVKGVHWYTRENKWIAYITVEGRLRYLGAYSEYVEAVCHRLAAEQSLDWAGCDDCSPAYNYVQSFFGRNMA